MHFPKSGHRQVGGAWIHPEAKIADGVIIEPHAVIGAGVVLGRGNWIGSGAVLYGPTVLGEDNQVHATAVIGGPPQDTGYKGEPTRLRIGHRNVFREGVTVNRASAKASWETRVGNDGYFMSGSHIAHDCEVGDSVILANDVLIAGHCRVGANANLAGGVAIAQFTTVGRFAFIGGLAGTGMDCEPFILHDGMPAAPHGINVVGLRRGHFPHKAITNLKDAYRVLFSSTRGGSLDLDAARREIERRGALSAEVDELLEFMRRSRAGRFGRQQQPQLTIKLIPEAPPTAEAPREG